MIRPMTPLLILAFLGLLTSPVQAQQSRRYALVVGHNRGDSSTQPLRYAEKDAVKMAALFQQYSTVPAENIVLLKSPTATQLERALEDMEERIRQGGPAGAELFFYYSGHADRDHLLLGKTRFPLADLAHRMESSTAGVRIVIIDACHSGAIVRSKGGKRVPAPTLSIAETTKARGMAIITSSAAGEKSQESDELRGSFFTHFLASGLQGEAAARGDGVVTLDEWYAFAYRQTLRRTASDGLHRQHPTFHYRMQGAGQVVVAYPPQEASSILFPSDPPGNYLVYDVGRDIVLAEIDTRAGEERQLFVAAGTYDILRRNDRVLERVRLKVLPGESSRLPKGDLKKVSRDYLIAKGERGTVTLSAKGGYQFFWDETVRSRSILPAILGGVELRVRHGLGVGIDPTLELVGGAGAGSGDSGYNGPLAQSSAAFGASLGVAFRLLQRPLLVELRPAGGAMYFRRTVERGSPLTSETDHYLSASPSILLHVGREILSGFSLSAQGKTGYLYFREDGGGKHLGYSEFYLLMSLRL